MKKKKNKKIKFFQASVLVATIIILGTALIIVLNAAIVTISQRKASLGESGATGAMSNSQSGMETVLEKISLSGNSLVSELNGEGGMVCNSSTKLLENSSKGYKLELIDPSGNRIDCDNSSVKLGQVAKIKSTGSKSEKQRAIEAVPPCYNSLSGNGMIGRWQFNGNYNDSTGRNNAQACNFNNYLRNNPGPNSSPRFVSEGGRSFVRLNEGSNRNCVRISDISAYHIREGTISFWMRYRTNPSGTWPTIFNKDANVCDTGTSPENTSQNGVNIACFNSFVPDRSECDCGHIGFRYNYPAANNFSVRFQNDGNGTHYELANNLSKNPINDWVNKWHLVTITFDSQEYVLYIDGVPNSKFTRTNSSDPDDTLEALRNNDWHIWLGAAYPYQGSSSLFEAKVDVDDFGIYNRSLKQCEVVALCQNT